VLLDRLIRRDTVARRAVRLRKTFERLGGTFIKVGQQMSMRLDLLPFEYCNELAKMLDKVKPFDVKYAVEAIERTTKKPLGELFSAFDPKPIGSASLACVFQATRKNGEKVAVKVRRPKIGEKFTADCTAFDWLLWACEWLTFVRPGQFAGLRTELRNVLLEELNFRREARYTELFALSIKENKQDYLGAPKVHFDLSSAEVLVTEFVSGIPLTEVLAAVDRKDEAALAKLREMNIKPRDVAKHLLRATMLGIYENIIFHSDPHPANVIVQDDSKLVLIDFGSSGSYTEKERRIMRQMQYYQAIGDVAGMVQAAVDLLEPLPPIDVESFTKKMELVWWQAIYALKSEHTEWWERTQMAMWIHMIDLTREYQMPININTLRVVRATLLIDSAAGRLDPHYDMYKEYDSFDKELGKLARKRVDKLSDRLLEGAEDRNYQRLEQALDAANRLFYQLQRKLDNPPNRFVRMIDKSIYAQSIFIRSLVSFALLTGAVVLAVAGVKFAMHRPVIFAEVARQVVTSGWYLGAIAFGALLNIRRVLYRYDDIDV
jgi:ubiquinone biosynthesis protein